MPDQFEVLRKAYLNMTIRLNGYLASALISVTFERCCSDACLDRGGTRNDVNLMLRRKKQEEKKQR